ncbi:MAG: UDP-N-acetylglucosamine 2-epimerase (hydrolyzing) [Planctomycetota bacterium]|nr:MAG: UDP-N-acetylglucosamine 2-epimerase (hydrolyzing) [Planctomycetota bacterium]
MGHGSLSRRRVAVVTGTRAEYGLLRSTMEAVSAHPRMTLQLVATGMHLVRKFGFTVRDLERDGRHIDARIPMQRGTDDPADQAEGLARGVRGMARFFLAERSDIVVVLGDRIEAMAGALAAVATDRILAHIHGGDVAPGDTDEAYRHAISKLAHVHLTATRRAARRLIRMGEDPNRVHVVGAPGLDDIFQRFPSVARSSTKTGRRGVETIDERRRIARAKARGSGHGNEKSANRSAKTGRALVVYHPCGRSAAHEGRVMRAILAAVRACGMSATVLYPNSDRGHSGIIEAIEAQRRRATRDAMDVVRSLPRETYLDLLAGCDVLVGNSSSGIIEAPVMGTPSVNVGLRQQGRERGGRSVIDCGESRASIESAIRRALRKRPITGGSGVYGDGRAGRRIAEILARIPLDGTFRRKRNRY